VVQNLIWIIKLFINKNNEENIDKDISFNDLFINKEENGYIDFIIDNLNLDLNNEENPNFYDKINISYIDIENKNYPLLKIIEHKNVPEYQNSKIVSNQNEIIIDLQFQILIFINPKIIKSILYYVKSFSEIFKSEKNNNKKQKKNKIDLNQEVKCNECNKNMNLKIKEIKIYLINEEETHLNIHKIFSDLPQNTIEYRKNNNYICINLSEIGGKLDCSQNIKKCNLYLKSLIIEDNIKNSKYKILFSNYNFKNKEEILIKCEIEIKSLTNVNNYEIKPTIKISPIAVYLDQITLYYIFNIFNQIKDKKKNENKENEKNENKEKNEIIEPVDNNNKNNNIIKNKNGKYIISNTIIDNFFLQLNYNTNDEVKDNEFLNKTIIIILNSISLKNLNINFNEYRNENNLVLNEAIKNIYKFYYDEIMNQIKSGSLATALPLINHITFMIDGALDIVREPIQNYKNNESIVDGFVHGIRSCVINTTTILTYLGESVTSYFNFFGCYSRVDNEDNRNINICRSFRNQINEKNKEIEDYYFK